MLGDLGANVIKIEPPAGDTVRQYPSTLKTENRAYLGLNRNKKSLVLDLKQPEAQAVLMRLVRTADVLVHNFRPSVPARLKIDYETLKAANPRLIYCSVTGFGNKGPLRERAGYDQLLQAATGMCALQGKTPDEPEIVWGSVVDYYTSSMLAFAVSSALFHRERTGQGQAISVSLLQSAMTMQSARIVGAEGEPSNVDRDFRSMGTTGIYPTAKGHLYLTTTAPHFWEAFCEGAGLTDLAKNPRYDTVRKRAEYAPELIPRIREALSQKPAKEWEKLLGDRVPCAAVRTTKDLFDDPQVEAEGLMTTFNHPKAGSYRGMCQPVSFSGSACPPAFAAPTFGQHSRAVLAQAGYSAAEIQTLVGLGAVKDQEDAA